MNQPTWPLTLTDTAIQALHPPNGTPVSPVEAQSSGTGAASSATESDAGTPDVQPVKGKCLLPLLDYGYDFDELNVLGARPVKCDGDLYLTREQTLDLEDPSCTASTWKVGCSNGHVLVVPGYSDADDDRYDHEQAVRALGLIEVRW